MNQFRTRKSLQTASVVISLVAALVGCRGGNDEPSAPSSDSLLFGTMIAREEGLMRVGAPESLAEALPNQPVSIGGWKPQPHSESVVIGRITDVTEADGYLWDEMSSTKAGDELVTTTDFDDPRASWRELHVTMDVDESLGGADDSVTFALTIGTEADVAQISREIHGLGTAIAVLDSDPDAVDPAVRHVLLDGALLGDVDEKSHIRFPGLGEKAQGFVGRLTSVKKLMAEGQRVKPVITKGSGAKRGSG